MKLLIIGGGSIGTRHGHNAKAQGCDVWVADPDEGQREKATQWANGVIPSWTTNQRFDAVMVCSPAETHLQWARQAVAMRIPVFVEKPLGTLDQIEDWRQLVRDAEGLTTMVGYCLRFQWRARAMHNAIAPAESLALTVTCDQASWPGHHYGHPLLELSHEIDLALWCGLSTTGMVALVSDRGAGFRTENGKVYLDGGAPQYYREWRGLGKLTGYRTVFNAPEELGIEMYVDELRHFLDCAREGRQTDCPLADGLRVLEVCQQIEQVAA